MIIKTLTTLTALALTTALWWWALTIMAERGFK
jgi:hypothetical protein